jgi:predicted enzyme related to lactoylglutathione lyase
MSGDAKPEAGAIVWTDLTVGNAERIRDFYADVVGWKPVPVDMGDYRDYSMSAPGSGVATAGICHARGKNADLPAQWLVYIIVESLDRSIEACRRKGGELIAGPKGMAGHGRYCVIRDPAGAVAALFEATGGE